MPPAWVTPSTSVPPPRLHHRLSPPTGSPGTRRTNVRRDQGHREASGLGAAVCRQPLQRHLEQQNWGPQVAPQKRDPSCHAVPAGFLEEAASVLASVESEVGGV